MPRGKRPTMWLGGLVLAVLLVTNFASGSLIKTINTEQLHEMIVDNAYRLEGGRQQHFTVVDARTKEEYDEDHIFSAISIPARNFEKLLDRLPSDKSRLLVVYDNGMKSDVSVAWAEKAAAQGYTNVVVYSEGFSVWKKSKMPVAPLQKTAGNQ